MPRVYAVEYDRFAAFRRVARRSGWHIVQVVRVYAAGAAYVTVERAS